MKASRRAHEIRSSLEGSAARKLGILQVLDGGEVLMTSAALVSGQRCSAGGDSGEYGCSKSKWTWSGTQRWTVVCSSGHPARSSTSTICLAQSAWSDRLLSGARTA
jgi:hypothetical protein